MSDDPRVHAYGLCIKYLNLAASTDKWAFTDEQKWQAHMQAAMMAALMAMIPPEVYVGHARDTAIAQEVDNLLNKMKGDQ